MRVIVLCASGNFCAGPTSAAAAAPPADPGELYHKAIRLFTAELPVVAAVRGLGGGLGLRMLVRLSGGGAAGAVRR